MQNTLHFAEFASMDWQVNLCSVEHCGGISCSGVCNLHTIVTQWAKTVKIFKFGKSWFDQSATVNRQTILTSNAALSVFLDSLVAMDTSAWLCTLSAILAIY